MSHKKIIAFFAGDIDNFGFAEPIISFLKDSGFEVRKYQQAELNEYLLTKISRECDLVWCEWGNGPVVPLSHYLKDCPIILRVHRYEVYEEWISKIAWANVHSVVFVNNEFVPVVKRLWKLDLPQLTNVHIIPNPLTGEYVFTERKNNYNLAYVSRFHKDKNPALMLQVLAALVKTDDRYHLSMAGGIQDMQMYDYCMHAIQAMNLQKHFSYDGVIKNIPEWLQDKSFFLSTSIVESQGKAILEAMMMGIKPIIHNGFGNLESIYGKSLVYNTVDEAVHLITSEEYTSSEYRDFAVTNFGKEIIFPKILSLVNEVIASRVEQVEIQKTNNSETVNPDSPFFSVVTFTYNRAKFLPGLIKSVLAQSLQNFEFIIVDDGSTDGTKEIVEALNEPRIKYYYKEHTNAPDTRNYALQFVRGKYIVWIGSDDLLSDQALEKHAEILANYPGTDIVYGNIRYVDTDMNFIREDVYEDYAGKEKFLIREMILANRLIDGGSAIRRTIYDDIGGYAVSFRRAHDYEFWTRVVERYSVQHIDYAPITAIWHDDNMSAATVNRDTSFEERVIQGVLNRLGMKNLFPEIPWDAEKGNEEKAFVLHKIAIRFAGLERWQKTIEFCEMAYGYKQVAEIAKLREFAKSQQEMQLRNHSLVRRKVLLVLHHFVPYRYAGVENYVYTFAKGLLDFGVEVHVLHPLSRPGITRPEMETDTFDGLVVHRLLCAGLEEFADHINNQKFNGLFNALLQSEKFSLVHFHHTLSLSFSFIRLAKQAGLPVIVTLHDSWYMCLRVHLFHTFTNEICSGPTSEQKCAECFYFDAEQQNQLKRFLEQRNIAAKEVLGLADYITAPSNFLAGQYAKHGFAQNVAVVPLGLHTVKVFPKSPGKEVVYGYLGSIQPLKNIGILFQAFSLINNKAKLLVFANGEEKDVAQLEADCKATPNIIYKGAYQLEQVGEVLAQVDVVIVPSLMENYPLVVREALCSGTPVLASKRGGIPEIIQHGVNGLLFDPLRAQELADIIDSLAKYPAKLEQLKRGTKPTLHIDDDVRQWIPRYETLLKNRIQASIIIPCFNQSHFTRQCLKSIYQNTPLQLFEVILIDNGSTDDTGAVIAEFTGLYANCRVISNADNMGFAHANNQGAAIANGEFLILMNNDIEAKENWLQPMLDILRHDRYVAAVGPKLLFADGTIQHAGVVLVEDQKSDFPLYGKHVFYGMPADTPQASIPRAYQALTAACLAIRKVDYNDVGGFDEAYWNGYEDVDLCFRLRQKGRKLIYQPASVLVHHESKSGEERFIKAEQNARLLQDKWKKTAAYDFVIAKDETITEFKHNIHSYYPGRKTSIVIPLYNNADYTRQCYESITKYTGCPYEIIFVDNASSDTTQEYIAQLLHVDDRIKYIRNDVNEGFPGAVNRGIKESTGDYVVIANNDILFTPYWLERLIDLAEAHPQIGITAPVSNVVSGVQLEPLATYKSIDEMYRFAEKLYKERVGKYAIFPRVAFLCVLLKRELITKIGGLDERFAPGNFEDDDYCLRSEMAGYKTAIAQDVFIHHYGSKSFKAEGQKKYDDRLKINHAKFVEKWGADADGIWIKGAVPNKRNIVFPISKDIIAEVMGRVNICIEENEFNLALEYLGRIIELTNTGKLQLPAVQAEPLYKLHEKLKQLVK
ncbi:MAG: glycosyltransferase [Ignavibacteria bacterium]|nr:glycosyltransferase [Ignavibacteria bacterium]